MDDRFAGIREFVTTVDRGSFTAAAETLGVTGSAVGKSISRLEVRLGVQLLHRTTRRIDLTTAGETFLLTCRRILEDLDQTEAFLSTGHEQPIGRLRVDLPTTFGRRHIVPVLLSLTERYPRLVLAVTLQDRAVDVVGEGVDLAVRIGALDAYPDLVARKLGEQKLVICGAPAYLARRGEPLRRDDLFDLRPPSYPASTELNWNNGIYSASNKPAMTMPMITRSTGSTSGTNRSMLVEISSS